MKGRVAIVTGGGRGIGEASGRALAAAGARVVLVSRTAAELEAAAAAIGDPDRVLTVSADIADEDAVTRVFDETLERFGDVHALVNNAGVFAGGKVEEIDVASWDRVMAVNVRGAFLASRELFRRLAPRGHGGTIVNLSSLGGLRGVEKFPGFTPYSVSKFAVIGLTECLAVEGRELGVTVNCVAPGAVGTRMLYEVAPFLETTTTPDDVARTIGFLCEEGLAGKLNGAILEIHSNQ